MSDLSGRTTVVVGASRGLGRGIARAFAEAGAPVVAVARTGPALAELATTSANIRTEVADAADAAVARSVLDQYEPEVLILVAGANPVMRPLQDQTWETFSVNWHTDVKIAFTWLREVLLKPLPPGSRVVVVSSGAAINGSPASGGYAGSKATQRFIAGYAQEESRRAGLDITGNSRSETHRPPFGCPISPTTNEGGDGFGNAYLRIMLPANATIVEPEQGAQRARDGALKWKIRWEGLVRGTLAISGRRLDSPAPPLRSEFHDYGDLGFQATYLIFPTPGCWEVTGSVAGHTLTVVVLALRAKDLKPDPDQQWFADRN